MVLLKDVFTKYALLPICYLRVLLRAGMNFKVVVVTYIQDIEERNCYFICNMSYCNSYVKHSKTHKPTQILYIIFLCSTLYVINIQICI